MKTVLITGGSRGIGAATALLFAEHAWNIALVYRQSRWQAHTVRSQINCLRPSCEVYQCDATDRRQVAETCDRALDRFGHIDVLVNNAGYASMQLFQDLTYGELERIFAVNVFGAFNFTHRLLPEMISRKQGVIVNVSSIWGMTGASCEVAYSAAKAALIGFTKALAKEVGPSGIRVNCVAPGVIDTDMIRGLGQETLAALAEETPLSRLGTAKDAASAIYYLSSEDSSYITGQVLSPNGGMVT